MSLTIEYLKNRIDYNELTGSITYKNCFHSTRIGTTANNKNKDGYIRLTFNKKEYTAHRLAWFYYYGTWPKGQIDHINGNRADNSIENLRDVTCRQNHQNRINQRNGHLVGTAFHKTTNKWEARIWINSKLIYLGLYNTPEEAHHVYLQAVKTLKGAQ